jgi:hypothetical protein
MQHFHTNLHKGMIAKFSNHSFIRLADLYIQIEEFMGKKVS